MLLFPAGSPAGRATHTVTITGGPEGTVTSTDASFSYTSSVRATFTCSLDSGGTAPCGSGLSDSTSYAGLAPGNHNFLVTATVSTRDTAQARRTWMVAPPPPPRDTRPPETTITSAIAGPVVVDGVSLPLSLGVVPLNIATFGFAADEPATFTCSLDGRATPCTSPLRNAHLRAGAHRFEVRATDLAGNTDPTPDVQAWSIGPVAGVVAANPKPMKIMGPKLLRPRDLLKRNFKRTSSRPFRGGDESEQATLEDEPGDDDCRIVACAGAGTAAFGRRGLAPPTPGLTSGPFIVGTNSNDPHIAASSTHIVVTNNGVIRFFNKSGKLLAQDKNAGTVVGAFNAIDFFRPAWFTPSNPPTINDGLNLPAGLKCNPTISLFDGNQSKPGDQPLSANQQAETKWCLDTVYDTRVIFDDYNKRFWILSVVRNESEGIFQALFPPTLRVGRRTRHLVAVSLTEDPRDGWYMYAWTAEKDGGACNDIGSNPAVIDVPFCPGTAYRPGFASDYPSLGISKDYFVTTSQVDLFGAWVPGKYPGYTNISAVSASGLANGGCAQACGWQYGPFTAGLVTSSGKVLFSGDPFESITQPAVQHGSPPEGATLLASALPAYDMAAVLSFSAKEGAVAPPLHVSFVSTAPASAKVNDLPQQAAGAVTKPPRVKVTNIQSGTLKAAARDDKLYLTWMDCKKWVGSQSECSTSIHLLVLGLDSGAPLVSPSVSADQLFGLNEPSDPEGSVVYYGLPAVEVNKANNAVVVYERTGSNVFLQAAYSALFSGQADVSAGAVLKKGGFPLGSNAATSPVAQVDTSGISVDPKDGLGIWMIHAFATSKGVLRYAIGKVFGSVYADLSVLTGAGIDLPPKAAAAGERLTVKTEISNDGDGGSRPVRARVYLHRKRGQRFLLGSAAVPALRPGAQHRLRLVLRLPKGLESGVYELEVVLPASSKEYTSANNAGSRELRVR